MRSTVKEPGMANNSIPAKSGYQVSFNDPFFKFLLLIIKYTGMPARISVSPMAASLGLVIMLLSD